MNRSFGYALRFAARSSLSGVLFLTVACAKNNAQPDPRGNATTDAQGGSGTTGAERDPCDAMSLGLGRAEPLRPFRLPQGCRATGGSASGPPTIVRSEEEYRAKVTCNQGAPSPSDIDFTKYDLALHMRTLSPGGAGFGAVDDGTKVTTIARQQPSCPSDPLPMPIPYTQAYLLPRHAERTFGEVACTIPRKCP